MQTRGLVEQFGRAIAWRPTHPLRSTSSTYSAHHIHARNVTVWPQWPHNEEAKNPKPIGEPEFKWPPRAPHKSKAGEPLSTKDMEKARKKTHAVIFNDMAYHDWNSWERRFWELRERAIPYDETTYSLLLHGYLLSHRHAAENAYMVLEEMRQAETHPALLRLNQRLLDSAFELRALGVQPPDTMWLNVVKLCYHSSARFQKKRRKRLQRELEALEPDEVLQLESKDAVQWLRDHDTLTLPTAKPGAGLLRFRTALPPSSMKGAALLAAPPEFNREPPAALPSPATGRRSRMRRRASNNGLVSEAE